MAGIARRPGVTYLCLVPNLRGYRARAPRASTRSPSSPRPRETFAKRNINMTIAESLDAFRDVVRAARHEGVWVRGYVSTAFGCPYEGDVPVEAVVRVASALAEWASTRFPIGDTIGVGYAEQVADIDDGAASADARRAARDALSRHARHRAGQRARGLAEQRSRPSTLRAAAWAAVPTRRARRETSRTEDLLYMLHGMGIETGVDLDAVRAASRFIAGVLRRDVPA